MFLHQSPSSCHSKASWLTLERDAHLGPSAMYAEQKWKTQWTGPLPGELISGLRNHWNKPDTFPCPIGGHHVMRMTQRKRLSQCKDEI
jgi:hypothetical protein